MSCFGVFLQFIVQLLLYHHLYFLSKPELKKALDQGQEPNVRGEHSRNSDYLEGEPSRTASQPEEQTVPPDFPANVQLHFSIADSQKGLGKPVGLTAYLNKVYPTLFR